MGFSSFFNRKLLLICFSAGFVSYFALSYRSYYLAKKKKKPIKNEIHEVIMFSDAVKELKKSKYSRCMVTASMERLLYHLNSPRYTLDICMYVMTNMDLANAVLKLHYRRVKIRIIVDADMAFSSGSSIRKFERQGIPVRWMKSTNLMHHKFCLVDSSLDDICDMEKVTPLVIVGSLNWTNQALSGNWEDVTVTSQPKLVRQFKQEFERLWVQFTPVVDLI